MRILVGMSGGLDSTYAALKLIKEGHEVVGAVAMMHEYTELSAALSAAENAGIPLHVIDASQSFDSIIKENFVSEYSRARTPNPCIICNERVKFRFLYDYAMEHGFDAIATGHYARVVKLSNEDGVRYALAVAGDAKKDQSYMLYRLPQDILARLYLPLADLTKEQVRAIASKRNIYAADRKASRR